MKKSSRFVNYKINKILRARLLTESHLLENRESFGELETAVETLAYGSCFCSFSCFSKLSLVLSQLYQTRSDLAQNFVCIVASCPDLIKETPLF